MKTTITILAVLIPSLAYGWFWEGWFEQKKKPVVQPAPPSTVYIYQEIPKPVVIPDSKPIYQRDTASEQLDELKRMRRNQEEMMLWQRK